VPLSPSEPPPLKLGKEEKEGSARDVGITANRLVITDSDDSGRSCIMSATRTLPTIKSRARAFGEGFFFSTKMELPALNDIISIPPRIIPTIVEDMSVTSGRETGKKGAFGYAAKAGGI
jgi:hypothetical protein